ncbi:MAG: MAPEG family protein [Gammaproteobacteria bacterium]
MTVAGQNAIFAPLFAMLFLTLGVWVYMYALRIPFIYRNRLTAVQMTPLEFARMSPAAISNPSDNLKNLFEIPVLFYVMSLYLFATQQVDAIYLAASWVFVVFRYLHSAVHCTVNIVLLRFGLYVVSALSLWFVVLRAAFRFYELGF